MINIEKNATSVDIDAAKILILFIKIKFTVILIIAAEIEV